jgi:hypothetical protein
MDGMSYQPALPGVGVPDRSPLDMPSVRARRVLQVAAVQLRRISAETGCFATSALADALEEAADGNDEAAFQAMQEAGAYRRMGA